MAAQNEVELIVRAKNLSTKTTNQLNKELSKIADNQEQIADANKLAERSFESLKSEQQQLLAVMKTLNDRAAKLNAFGAQEQKVKELRAELARARDQLGTLANEFFKVDKPTKEFTDQMKAADSQVGKLESQLRNAERRLESTGNKLHEMGVDTTRFAQEQTRVNSAIQQSVGLYKRSTDNMERYDAAVQEVRASQLQVQAAERAAAQEARDSSAKLEQAAKEREEQLKREGKFAELTANVYRTLALEREKAGAAGAAFRAGGAQALAAARATAAPGVGSGSSAGGAAAGVQALLDPAKDAVSTLDRLEKEVEQLDKEFKSLTPETLQAAEGMEKLADQSRRLREAASALKNQASLADELSKQNAALVASQQRFEAARQEVIQYAQAVERADQPNNELAASLQRAQTEMRQAHAELLKQTDGFNRVQQRAAAAGITLNNLAGIEQRLAQQASRVRSGQEQVAQTMTRLDQTTRKVNTQMKLFNDGQRTALSLYQRTRGQVLSLVSAYVGVFGAINLVQQSMDAAIERERIMSRLLVANKGDANAAAQEFAYLRKKADELGQVFGPLADSYSRFAVAARDAGMSTEATRFIFESFTEASTALRLSSDETAGAFKALEQIFSKGFIQAEELRGQLGDRLTGAFNLFAKAIGVTTEQLNKMLEKGGQVRAEFVLLAAQQARGIYGPQAKEAAKSMLGDLNRMQNAWGDLKREIIDGGLGDALRQLFVDLAKFLKSDDGKKFAENLTKVLTAAVQAGGELVRVFAENDRIITLVADTVSFLVRNFKSLLAIMLAIQGARIASVFTGLATEIYKARAASIALNAVLGAGTAASAAQAGTAVTALISGPIAALLAIAATAIVIRVVYEANTEKQRREIHKTTADIAKDQDDLLRRMVRAREQSADSNIELIKDIQRSTQEAGKSIEELQKKIAENNARRLTSSFAPSSIAGVSSVSHQTQDAATNAELAETIKMHKQLASLQERRNQLAQMSLRLTDGLKERAEEERKAGNGALAAEFDRIRKLAEEAAKRADEEKKKKGKKEKDLSDDRIRLAEQTADKLREIEEGIIKTQDDTLANRLALIKSEMDQKREELKKLIEEAKKLNDEASQKSLEAGLLRIDTLQAGASAKETKEFNTDQVEKNEQKINDILQQRSAILETNQLLVEAGAITQQEASDRMKATNEALLPTMQELVLNAQAFINTLSDPAQIAKAQAALDLLKAQIQGIGKELSNQQRQVVDVFVNGFGSAFMQTATLIADTLKGVQSAGDAWKAFGDIVLNTIADILVQLAQMIIQQAIFNALKQAAENGGGGFWGTVINAAASYLHTGGVVGAGEGRRGSVPSYVFTNATRYHTGGVAGLAPDEVPAVLKRNEEVLTEDDPRHRFNGGMGGTGGSTPVDLTVINTIDSESVVAAGANTRTGRQAIFNAVKADASSYRKLLGVS